MTDARHDYPPDPLRVHGDDTWERMCDEIDRLRAASAVAASADAVLRKAVADTFRTIINWGTIATIREDGTIAGIVSREEVLELAEQVETGDVDDWWACPVCEESECDDGCPLQPLRTRGL